MRRRAASVIARILTGAVSLWPVVAAAPQQDEGVRLFSKSCSTRDVWPGRVRILRTSSGNPKSATPTSTASSVAACAVPPCLPLEISSMPVPGRTWSGTFER